LTRTRPLRIFAHRAGNIFMQDLAELVAAEARDLGRSVEIRTAGAPVPDGALGIVIAPHEYFHLEPEVSPDRWPEFARSCAFLTTERPGTPWFELSASISRACPAVVDIHPAGAAALQDLGVDASRLQIGYTPHWDRWRLAAEQARDVDVLFLGATTPHRHAVLAGLADVLGGSRCEVRLFESDQPVISGDPDFLSGERLWEKLARSRVLLNIRRAPHAGYFEWARCLPAVLNGAVIVTQPSEGTAPLVPFEHFVAASPALVGAHLQALLDDEEARCRMATDAYDELRTAPPLRKAIGDFIARAEDVVPVHRSGAKERAVRNRDALWTRASAALEAGEEPASFQAPEFNEGHALRFAAKRLLIESLRVRRTLDRLSSARASSPEPADVSSTPAHGDISADVSVVVPVFNHGAFVAGAVESALRSDGVIVEVVVVDDGSTDSTPSVLTQLLSQFSHRAVKVVRLGQNQGLPAARNAGFAHASAPLVFPLDADNTLLPYGLSRLKAGLGERDAFCYGIVAAFGDSHHLLSCLPWNVARLCKSNYIDGMALVRRSTWERVGGYTSGPDDVLFGWEDYGFWLACAAAGLTGRLVPTVVGRYRVRRGSMISITNLETDSAFAYLRHTHPQLPWPAVA
jgi:hypothetical protein